jgi:DNA invertase Pin-like site-specific DNA recombinase
LIRCAIYTRKSTEEGLEQSFHTLQAQREAAEAYILSHREEGWRTVPPLYDDRGWSGANLERPGLTRLLADVEARRIDCVVVYKVDRLSRSLLDFTRLLSLFEKRGVSFVSVTQDFHTSSSMGRLTLHILLSFAQFEREIIGERTRDKLSAARRKGKWIGGVPVLGYDVAPARRTVAGECGGSRTGPRPVCVRRLFFQPERSCGRSASARLEGEAVDQPKRENARRAAVEPVHAAAVADERFVSWGHCAPRRRLSRRARAVSISRAVAGSE